ncbi:Rcd4 [Drosophila busckii]|uniref:Rcd4 n=1 Tax=Drosophila busckii TaxID=30019 RepID=A0A0M5IZA9_DROBS|nr:Rcd4 [Drosophila busckii]
MAHAKRDSRMQFNPNCPGRREPVPKVCVRADNGEECANLRAEQPRLKMAPAASAKTQAAASTKAQASAAESVANAISNHRFGVPRLNTTLRKQSELNSMHQLQLQAVIDPNLSPRTMQTIAPKVTQKLNFPPDRAVFNDLVPLNVNDSVHEMQKELPKKDAAGKPKNGGIKEPQLADYLERIEPVHIEVPEPDLELDFPHEEFDFMQAYKRIYDYEEEY